MNLFHIISFFTLTLTSSVFAFDRFPSDLKQKYLIPHNQALSAKQYVLIDADTMTIIDEHHAEEQVPPASLTKMMAIQIVNEALKRGTIKTDDITKVSQAATKVGGSSMFLETNSKVSLHELIQGSIVASGNDATVALAEYISGSEAQFVEIMNNTAQEYGMTKTHFVTSTGMPHKEHYSTALDLALLSTHVTQINPDIYKIYSQKWFTHNNIKQNNRNRLLWRDPSVDGLKSGTTKDAGYCLATTAKRGDMRLISIVLGTPNSSSRDHDSQKLIDYGFRFFEQHDLFKANDVVSTLPVYYGTESSLHLTTKHDIKLTIPKGSTEHIKTTITPIHEGNIIAPIDQNTQIASLVVSLHDNELKTFPLYAKSSITQASWIKQQWQWLTYQFNGWT